MPWKVSEYFGLTRYRTTPTQLPRRSTMSVAFGQGNMGVRHEKFLGKKYALFVLWRLSMRIVCILPLRLALTQADDEDTRRLEAVYFFQMTSMIRVAVVVEKLSYI